MNTPDRLLTWLRMTWEQCEILDAVNMHAAIFGIPALPDTLLTIPAQATTGHVFLRVHRPPP